METEQIELDREDIVLLILEANERLLRRSALNGITRLEKLLFLLEKETAFEGVADFFPFEAHYFGPFSKEVYAAVEFLDACELIEVREKSYGTLYSSTEEAKLLSEITENDYSSAPPAVPADEDQARVEVTEKQFSLTANGRKVAQIIRAAVLRRRPSDVEQLDAIIRKYATLPLNSLIRYVYRQHPDMTINSIHPEASRLS